MKDRRGKTYISAFAFAKLSSAVTAEITIENVLAARPDWNRELAEQFLAAHGHAIAEAMELGGQEALMELLPRNTDVN